MRGFALSRLTGRLRAQVMLSLVCLLVCRCEASPQRSGIIALVQAIPFGESRATIMAELRSNGLDTMDFDAQSRTLLCRVDEPASSTFPILKSRLIAFVFASDDRLTELRIEQQLTGP
jgi:hypothetical protein